MPTKTSVPKVFKKKPTSAKKKPLLKKKKTVAPVLTLIEHDHDALDVEQDEAPAHTFQKRLIFVGTCNNCDHLPMRINKLVALMSYLILILSSIVIAQANPLDVSGLILAVTRFLFV